LLEQIGMHKHRVPKMIVLHHRLRKKQSEPCRLPGAGWSLTCPQKPDKVLPGNAPAPTYRPGAAHRLRSCVQSSAVSMIAIMRIDCGLLLTAKKAKRKRSLSPSEILNQNCANMAR
jgi:hypothetical protein